MTEAHLLICILIVLVLWCMGVVRLNPWANKNAEKELARTFLKERRGVFK